MVAILLVEDHAAFANVLLRLLRSRVGDLQVIEVARTAEIALQKLPEHEYNLALVDVFLPQMSGISLVELMHARYPDLPCMMLSGHMLDHYVQRALKAGALGYVLKDHSDEIIEGIQHILKGETYLSRELRHA
jgi:DNA-binding NarL/FixJ family response regulator